MPTRSFRSVMVAVPARPAQTEASSVRRRTLSALITALLADAIAVARQVHAFRADPIAQRKTDEHRADPLPLLLVGSRDAGGRKTDVDADCRAPPTAIASAAAAVTTGPSGTPSSLKLTVASYATTPPR